MKRSNKTTILILALIILTACSPKEGSSDQKTFRSGSEGYSLILPKDRSLMIDKDEIQETQINVEVRNKGAYPERFEHAGLFTGPDLFINAYIWLGGFDPKITKAEFQGNTLIDETTHVPIIISHEDQALGGKSQLNPKGGKNIFPVTFTTEGALVQDTLDKYKPKVSGVILYNYKTIATPALCIDPNPSNTNQREKACTTK